MIGRRITFAGRTGDVESWEPLSAAMCDALVLFDDGSRCWFASRELRPADGLGPLPARADVMERAKVAALAQLRDIRAAHVREFSRPWPGCEHGKAVVGMAIDGAIESLRGVR